MKQLLIIGFLFCFQFSNGQFFNNGNGDNFIVQGDAILRIQPDQVVFSLGVESRGKDLLSTKNENYAILKKAIEYCKRQKIEEKYIQTDYVHISPHFEYGGDVTIDYYNVSQSFSIVLEDLDKYEEILSELLNLGINQVKNIEFRTSKLKEYRYQVRKMAIEAAKEKAEFLSGEVNIELGEITNISEYVSPPQSSFGNRNYANYSQNSAQSFSGNFSGTNALSVGLLSLKASIQLTYSLKPSSTLEDKEE
tara:strand:+ start:1933 stop:2682 length:750 start_codon:yes stop_codon:yes gene_type:complete